MSDAYKDINEIDSELLDEIKQESIIHQSNYKDLKTEMLHIGAIVVLALIAIFGIRYLLASSSPTAKAKAVILACALIATSVFVTMYFNGNLAEIWDLIKNVV